MGLINWFKDKVILHIEHDLALLSARQDGMDMRVEQLQSQIISIRQKRNNVKPEQEEGISQKDAYDQIVKAFGGDVPIELLEKYKKEQRQ